MGGLTGLSLWPTGRGHCPLGLAAGCSLPTQHATDTPPPPVPGNAATWLEEAGIVYSQGGVGGRRARAGVAGLGVLPDPKLLPPLPAPPYPPPLFAQILFP